MDRKGGEKILPIQGCNDEFLVIVIRGSMLLFCLALACKLTHSLLRPLSQPRIISELIVGVILGTFVSGNAANREWLRTVRIFSELGMVGYLFVLGLEMDPYVLFHRPTQEAQLTYAGILSTLVVTGILSPLTKLSKGSRLYFIVSLSVTLSNTASPVLTRLITDLKIGKSEIGRLAINAGMHSDMFTTLLITLGFVFNPFSKEGEVDKFNFNQVLVGIVALIIQLLFTAKVLTRLMDWINKRNPEGKPMKDSHLILALGILITLCMYGPLTVVSPMASSFLTGLVLPREGRLSKLMINKLNHFLNAFVFPVYFVWVGMQIRLKEFGEIETWGSFFFLCIIAAFGKVAGTLVCGVHAGLHWTESIGLGLLLSTKGHFHIYSVVSAVERGALDKDDVSVMILVDVITIVYIPMVVAFLVRRARLRSKNRVMALQWLDPSTELRMLLCLHGPQSVPSAINIMEVSRGLSGITVFATDMIELTDRIAATLVRGEGLDAVTVSDETVVSMREQISNRIQAFMEQSGEGITLRRLLVVSAIDTMHEDVCNLAEDVKASIIILPFHKSQRVDGKMDDGHEGFRQVNRKVLRQTPCSVGILVDRGLGLINNVSTSYASVNVSVIFIGGKDDREALAYAGRLAQHPGINLTVIRFLLDSNADAASIAGGGGSGRHVLTHISEQEEEMRLDDECFAEFYETHVAEGRASYSEKYVANSAELVTVLSSLEEMYSLFIVGRGARVNKTLTAGMSEWEECQELGSIGDILAASDFSLTASVLIIQQHNPKGGDTDGLGDEFSII